MRFLCFTTLTAALALAGCDKTSTVAAGTPVASTAKGSTAPATAEQVAHQARKDVRCPARATSATRAGEAPVDDVLGVRPGLSYDEAVSLVLCSHELLVLQDDPGRRFNLNAQGQKLRHGFGARFAEPRVEWNAKRAQSEMLDSALARSGNAVSDDLKPGQAKWYVGTMGLPGQERVVNVAREERFDANARPTVASVEQALVKKYGPPSRQQNLNGQRHFSWTYDPMGRQAGAGSPLVGRCVGIASPDSGVNLASDCGTVVTASVMPLRDNPDVAMTMQVGVVDQARGYALVTSTEQALLQAEQQRRAKETANAAKNTAAPKL